MLHPIEHRSLYLAVSLRVALATGFSVDAIRAVCMTGMLEGIPAHHTLRGIYKGYKGKK